MPGDQEQSSGSARGPPYQAIQLGDGALAARLADVPDLHAALAAGVDVPGGVADGDGAHHLAVAQRVDLPGVPRDAGTGQGVVGKGHRLHLPVGADVEGVGSARGRQTGSGVSAGGRALLRWGGGGHCSPAAGGCSPDPAPRSSPSRARLIPTQSPEGPSGAYGFPPGMDARLEGRPGALMGGCGSKPTCRETRARVRRARSEQTAP